MHLGFAVIMNPITTNTKSDITIISIMEGHIAVQTWQTFTITANNDAINNTLINGTQCVDSFFFSTACF